MSLGNYITSSVQTTYSGTIPVPVSGTDIFANDVVEPVRALGYRTDYLYNLTFQAFGGLFQSSSTDNGVLYSIQASDTVQFAGANASFKVFANNKHPASTGLHITGSGITASYSGTYRATMHSSIFGKSGATYREFEFCFRVNGLPVTTSIGRFASNSTSSIPVSLQNYLTLNPNDVVDIGAQNSGSAAVNVDVKYSSFFLERVGI